MGREQYFLHLLQTLRTERGSLEAKRHSSPSPPPTRSPSRWAQGVSVQIPFFSVASWLKAPGLGRMACNDSKWLTGWLGNLSHNLSGNPSCKSLPRSAFPGLDSQQSQPPGAVALGSCSHPHPDPVSHTVSRYLNIYLLYLLRATFIKINDLFAITTTTNPQTSGPHCACEVTITQLPMTKLGGKACFSWAGACFHKGSSLTFSVRGSRTPQEQWQEHDFPSRLPSNHSVFLKLI